MQEAVSTDLYDEFRYFTTQAWKSSTESSAHACSLHVRARKSCIRARRLFAVSNPNIHTTPQAHYVNIGISFPTGNSQPNQLRHQPQASARKQVNRQGFHLQARPCMYAVRYPRDSDTKIHPMQFFWGGVSVVVAGAR